MRKKIRWILKETNEIAVVVPSGSGETVDEKVKCLTDVPQTVPEVGLEVGKVDIIAEDLCVLTADVLNLRKRIKAPGMSVLQFAFD